MIQLTRRTRCFFSCAAVGMGREAAFLVFMAVDPFIFKFLDVLELRKWFSRFPERQLLPVVRTTALCFFLALSLISAAVLHTIDTEQK